VEVEVEELDELVPPPVPLVELPHPAPTVSTAAIARPIIPELAI
jgi:hypothetical protein